MAAEKELLPPHSSGITVVSVTKRLLLALMLTVGIIWVLGAVTRTSYAETVVQPEIFADGY